MSKTFWGVIAAIVVIFGLVFIFKHNNSKNNNNSSSTKPTEHIEGKGEDHVALVEYGDYQCPYCGQYYPIVKQVVAQYSNQITFQFRNFPLTSLHPNAFAGARAAEAAGLMGKFWQMHDLLYEQNDEYYNTNGADAGWIGTTNPEPVFVKDAESLGLNSQKFQQLYSSSQVDNLIEADISAGNSLNVGGTPTFFLDGKQINVGESASEFDTLINAAIAQKTGKSSSTPTSSGTTSQSKK